MKCFNCGSNNISDKMMFDMWWECNDCGSCSDWGSWVEEFKLSNKNKYYIVIIKYIEQVVIYKVLCTENPFKTYQEYPLVSGMKIITAFNNKKEAEICVKGIDSERKITIISRYLYTKQCFNMRG